MKTDATSPHLQGTRARALMAVSAFRVAMPRIQYAGEKVDLPAEARKARRRLYPVSVAYSTYALAMLALAVGGTGPARPLAFFLAGVLLWTLIECLVHRYVLHGRFPDGPGALQHWLHVAFDTLHTEHHARPWDGNHINGTITDTVLYVAFLAALSFLAPLPTAPVLLAGVLQAYVVEEWVHHAVHFIAVYELRGPYWRYIVRHHCYHHSPRGAELAFGLTSGAWDVVFGTRVPEEDRKRLYGRG